MWIRRGLDYHGTRLDLVKPAVPVARHSLVVPVRVKLSIIYQTHSGPPFRPSDPNEPSHPDQEEEEPYPPSNPSDDDPQIVGSG